MSDDSGSARTPPATTVGSEPHHLIFGGSGGVGAALARRLAQQGARVELAARRAEPLAALATEIGAAWHQVDASDFAAVDALVARVAEQSGRLDGIAVCVGSILLKPAHRTEADEWAAVLSANLSTAFAAVRAAGAHMAPRGGGSVLLFSSAAARYGLSNHEALAAAKAGVEGLVRSAAATYAHRKLRFNAIAPGLLRTPLSAHLTSNEAQAQKSVAMHALGQLGTPEEVASLASWLLDPAHGWVTGQVFGIDGGLAAVRPR